MIARQHAEKKHQIRVTLAAIVMGGFLVNVVAMAGDPQQPVRFPAVYVSDRDAEDPEHKLAGERKPMKFEQDETLTPKRLLCQVGQEQPATFTTIKAPFRFDVVNPGSNHLMVAFLRSDSHAVAPALVRLAPGKRQTVTLTAAGNTNAFSLSYTVTQSMEPFGSHSNRYRAYCDGETVMCVPVPANTFAAMLKRTESILSDSKALVTDKAMPDNTYIYTPGPFYRQAGIFARDFLYQLEGAGRYTATVEETRRAVDYLALKQLTENKKVGAFTYPKGAIPDHVYPDGRWCWGPGAFYGDNTAHFRRPSMDEAMCFVTLGWHYGYNAYQDGGYWYYMSLGVAVTLNRKHPDLAREWVGNAYADLAAGDTNPPYERVDGMKPENNRYNASVGPLMGMGRPATIGAVDLTVGRK